MIRRILSFIVTFVLISSLFVFAAAGDETVIRFDADDYESSSLWDSLDDTKPSEQVKTSEQEQEAEAKSESQVQTQNFDSQETTSLWGSLSDAKENEPEHTQEVKPDVNPEPKSQVQTQNLIYRKQLHYGGHYQTQKRMNQNPKPKLNPK